jgi:RimJ/RimL family protein N-acetyltransferase
MESIATLNAATRATIARFGAEQTVLFLELLQSLDLPSRVGRFGHLASDASIETYVKAALSAAAFTAGAFVEGKLVGVVEVFETRANATAEVAFAVHADWRRHGFASALLDAAKRWAEASGVRVLSMVISPSNTPMRRLAERVGASIDIACDEICAEIAVAASYDMAA